MPARAVLTLPWTFVITHRTAFRHHLLYGLNLVEKFLFGRIVPWELVQVVLPVAQQSVGWGATGGFLNQAGVSQGLKPVRLMRALGDFSGLLFDRNEF